MKRHLLLWTVMIALPVSFAGALGPEWLSTPRPIGKVIDLTASTGVNISSGVALWGALWNNPFTTLHAAGRSSPSGSRSGKLYVFSWGDRPRVDDVTAQTGFSIVGSPIFFWWEKQTLAAISDSEKLTFFTVDPDALPDRAWTAETLPVTGITGNLVSWITPSSPNVLYVAATTTSSGGIKVLKRRTGQPDTVVDVSAQTGVFAQEGGLGGGWSVVGSAVVDQLVVTAKDGKLYHLDSVDEQPWKAREIPLPAGQAPTPDVSGWLSLTSGERYVAVRTQSNALVVMTRGKKSTDLWVPFNLTAIDGEEVAGRPVPYQPNLGDPALQREGLIVPGKNGQALFFWRTGRSPLWQLLDLRELTGDAANLLASAWAPVVPPSLSEHVAGAGPDGHLRVVYDFREARMLTERVGEQFETLSAQSGTRQTVAIVWNPETTATNCPNSCGDCTLPDPWPKLDPTKVDEAMRNVSAYFQENSAGLLAVTNKTLGPYASLKHRAHYTRTHGPGLCLDGWNTPGGGGVEKLAEAIRQADAGFDFTTLPPDNFAVIVMIPGTEDRGAVRPVVAENNAALVVDGVTIGEVIEITVGSTGVPHLGTVARELSRYLFQHVDMAWGTPFPRPATALGALTPMDGVVAQGHLDAFTKLKLGWVRPRILWHPGTYTLKDVETRHSVRVLLNPARDTGEFFVFENRFRGSTFDRGLPADGLAIYHVMQDPVLRQNARPPFYVSAADWGRIGTADWGRRAVRLIPPVPRRGYVSDGGSSVPYDDSQSLWKAPVYDLEPFPFSHERASLRYGDGSNPELAIRSISPVGMEMSFTVAPASVRALCDARRMECGELNDGLGGKIVCGTCVFPKTCGGGGFANVCGCPFHCDQKGDE